jgi:hypothetical protein
MQADSRVADIAHVIQTSVAPVFLLSGVATTLTVLTNRLARIIDRARVLQTGRLSPPSSELDEAQLELVSLSRRARLIHRAITLSTTCALLICAVIVFLFLGAFLATDPSDLIVILFIMGMLSFIGALLHFLREIFVATGSLHFTPPVTSSPPPPAAGRPAQSGSKV